MKGFAEEIKPLDENENEYGAPDVQAPKLNDGFDDLGGAPVEEGEGPWLISYADLMTLLMGFFALIVSISKPDVEALEQIRKSTQESLGIKYEEPYKDLESALKKTIENYGLQGQVSVLRSVDGVSLKFEGQALFDSGSFTLKDEGSQSLHAIINAIQRDVARYQVQIDGHTDDVPISHAIIASNWELSAIRAARVAQLLEGRGFKKEQLTIQGWGETRPEVPNVDSQGRGIASNRAKNRRILLKIYDTKTDNNVQGNLNTKSNQKNFDAKSR